MNIEHVSAFPNAPGVYIMKNSAGEVLYVGKAKNLRARVRSYFGTTKDSRYQIQFLMAKMVNIDYIVTSTEKEALILENTLIKRHRPRYNINLRDDKTYFSLRMDPNEEFPRLAIVRTVSKDNARYFGPYASATAAREVLKQLYRLFPLRHYPLETCRRRNRPCLYYQLRQCSAPCQGLIAREEYAALAEGAALFLEGKSHTLVKLFKKRMVAAAAAEKFEEAARFRDVINAIEITVEKQHVVTERGDLDALGYTRRDTWLEVALLFFRGGSLTGCRNYRFPWEMDDALGIASFITEYYNQDIFIPGEILIPLQIPECEAMEELFTEKRGKRVAISTPRRGTKVELVQLATKNAETTAEEYRRRNERAEQTLQELQQRLHLQSVPRRIECYDISTLQGNQAVGSRVVFQDGQPDKKGYRRYRIKVGSHTDDYGMMREVLSRRFAGSGKSDPLPDLILIDGGIGQLNVLITVLTDLGISSPDTAALAKSRTERAAESTTIVKTDERIFLRGRKNPVVLRQNSTPLLLLARIRDEAHQFAVRYHTTLRSRESLGSAIGKIAGIGEKRWKDLLRHFGSLQNMRTASIEELTAVRGINRQLATVILEHLQQQ
jgi:excinuclease ABC subunit C